jgi:hypothetical protein
LQKPKTQPWKRQPISASTPSVVCAHLPALWSKPKDEGGSNGAVPSALQGRILAIAQARGLNLTAEDLILRSAKDWSL